MAPFRVLENRRSLALPLAALAFLVAPGCGGGKGGSPSGPRVVSVTATPNTVAYGGETTIRWSSASETSLNSSNFGVGDGNVHGGSIVDQPGTTTSYDVRVDRPDGGDSLGRATVTVAKIPFGVLVLGDAARPGPNQMREFARTLASGDIGLSATLPAPGDTYEVLLVSPTVAFTSDLKDRVKAWLDAGKGVVLCGRAPSVIATGNPSETDVSAIGSWFFGVDRLDDGASFSSIRESAEGLVLLSAAIRTDDIDNEDLDGSIGGFGPQVDPVAGGELCAYAVPSGGRLVYSASPVGYGDEPGGVYQQAFESAFRWAGL